MSRSNELTKSIIGLLKLRGFMAWRNQAGKVPVGKYFMSFGEKGSSDVMALSPDGVFWAVEVKAGKDRISADQLAWHLQVKQRHGRSIFATCIDDVISALDKTNKPTGEK